MKETAREFLDRLLTEARESLISEYTGDVNGYRQYQDYLEDYNDDEPYYDGGDADYDDDFGDKDEQTYVGVQKVKGKTYWYPKVFYAYVAPMNGEDCYVMDIAWVPDQTVPIALSAWSKYSDIFTCKWIPSKLKAEPRKRIECYIPVKNLGTYLEKLPEILQSAFFDRPRTNLFFGDDAIQNLETYIRDRLASTPNRQEFENTRARLRKMAGFVMAHLDDSRVTSALQKISGQYYDKMSPSAQKAKGHQLSPENKIMIYAQMPDATFVTQEWCWREYFHRKVVDKNKYAIILKPRSDLEPNQKAMELACQKCGFKDYATFQMEREKLSKQQVGAVMMWYGILNDDPTSFLSIKVYDESNTEMIEGNDDTFNTEAGYENNLLGVPNRAAIAQDRQLAAQEGGDYVPGEVVNVGSEVVRRIATVVRKLLGRRDIVPDSKSTPEENIFYLAYKYAEYRVDGSGLEDPAPYCDSFASLVQASFGYPAQKGMAFFNWLREKGAGDTTVDYWKDTIEGEFRKFMGYVADEINRVRKGTETANAKRAAAQKKDAELKPTGTDPNEFVNEAVGQEPQLRELSDLEIEKILGLTDDANPVQTMYEQFERLLDGMEMLGR